MDEDEVGSRPPAARSGPSDPLLLMDDQGPQESKRELDPNSPVGMVIVVVVFGVFLLLCGALIVSHWQKYGNPFTAQVRAKKKGAKQIKRQKMKQGMTVLGD